jgi:pimeloyl-ACP methyl ester carboxylesterase
VATDVEAVRAFLGYQQIDYYGTSYGTVSEQAYAARYPDRLHALVFDAGFPITDPAHQWFWGVGQPAGIVRAAATICARTPACASADPDPAGTIEWIVRRVGDRPVEGEGTGSSGTSVPVTVDEAEVANILRTFDFDALYTNPVDLIAAAAALRAGDPQPLLDLAADNPLWGLGSGDPEDFSSGDNAAAQCNDADFVWDRSDPIDVRQSKFDEAMAALASDQFAPFSVPGWIAYGWPDICLEWPAPNRFEPVIPEGTVFPKVPTLILAGDIDSIIPVEQVSGLRALFPGAEFVVVAGAGHPVTGSAWGHCAAELVAQLFDQGEVSDRSCAESPA